jgi:hypothetical protein
MMKIAVFGTGTVGQSLAGRLSELGHKVIIGTRNISQTLARTENDGYGNPPFAIWQQSHTDVELGTFKQAAEQSQLHHGACFY